MPFGNVFTMPEHLDHALPSPQGEGLKVRVLRHHRAAHPRPLPHFQSSMLLHNLSSVFSLSKKASQRALRCTRALHRTAAFTHPAANAHQAAPVSANHRRSLHAPGRSAASDRNGPTRRKAGFPQSLHRVFHIFAGFPQRLSFPLAFFERDRVRYAYAVRSYCAVRPGLVWSGWVRYGAPLLLCDITRDEAARRPPATRARTAGDKQCKPLQLLKISVCGQCYVNRFSCPVSNPVACAAGFAKTRPKAFLARSLRTFPREFCGILPLRRAKRAALSDGSSPF